MHKGHRKHRGMDLSCIPTVTDPNISCNVVQNINVIIIARYRGEKSDQGNSFSIGSERLKRKEAGSLITPLGVHNLFMFDPLLLASVIPIL